MNRLWRVLVSALCLSATGNLSRAEPARATDSTTAVSAVPHDGAPQVAKLRQQPSFWDDAKKEIMDGGRNLGSWLAYRRQLLVEASLMNRYFWFCITSFVANVVLLYLFYAARVSEDRRVWKATTAMTDLWNWALYSDWTARNAIGKFNAHIEKCNRDSADGLPGEMPHSPIAIDTTRAHAERESLEKELLSARAELLERDRIIADLNARVDAVAKNVTGNDVKLCAQLMEKVNMLTVRNQHLEEQLESAQAKLGQVAHGV